MLELLDDLCVSVEELEDGFEELSEQGGRDRRGSGRPGGRVLRPDDEDDCGCGHCHHDEDEAEFEVTCPSCGDTIQLTDDMLEEGSIVCPGCGEDPGVRLRNEEDEEEDKE